MASGLRGDDTDRAGGVEACGEAGEESLPLGLGERAGGGDAPGEFDAGAAGVDVLAPWTAGAGGVEGEFVRGDRELGADPEWAAQRVMIGVRRGHERGP